jgi:hypothetical protein
MEKQIWKSWWKAWMSPLHWSRKIDAYHRSIDMIEENAAYEKAKEENLRKPNVYVLSDFIKENKATLGK